MRGGSGAKFGTKTCPKVFLIFELRFLISRQKDELQTNWAWVRPLGRIKRRSARKGADFSTGDRHGSTPIHDAVTGGRKRNRRVHRRSMARPLGHALSLVSWRARKRTGQSEPPRCLLPLRLKQRTAANESVGRSTALRPLDARNSCLPRRSSSPHANHDRHA